MSDLDDMDIRQYDEADMQDAARYQQQLDERRRLDDGWKWWPSLGNSG